MSIEKISGPELPGAGKGVLTLTPAAVARVEALLAQRVPRPEALVVSVTSKGCSGLSYDIQYLERLADRPAGADVVAQQGVTVVVDPEASLYIIGSVMDYRDDGLRSGFDFNNPNEVARCGCGESFTVSAGAEKKGGS